jgi:hypothetical protein
MTKQAFNIGKWHGALLTAAGAYEALSHLVEDETSVRHHADNRVVITGDSEGIRSIPLKASRLAEHLRAKINDDISWAHLLYSSQMIVLAATHLESMLDEFFQTAFLSRPQRMTEFLQGEGEKQLEWNVSLKEVIASASVPELLGRIANRAVANANSGSAAKVLRRVERITKYSLPRHLVDRVVALSTLRNEVVHNMKIFEISRDEVVSHFHMLIDLLKELGNAAEHAKIPIDDASELVMGRP